MAAVKQAAGTVIGGLVCGLPPLRAYKARLLSTWTDPQGRGGLDRLIFSPVFRFWQEHEYLAEADPDRREMLKDSVMGSEAGARWAAHYDERPLDFDAPVGALTMRVVCPVLTDLDERLRSVAAEALILQVGSSSGRELAWLASRHPGHRFLGIDIYKEVVDYAAKRHAGTNLAFSVHSAKDAADLAGRHGAKPVFVFSSGSLQYVQPEHLQALFDRLAALPDAEIHLAEPASETGGSPLELSGSRWMGNMAYNHDYGYYARKSGMTDVRAGVVRPYVPAERFPSHAGTVSYLLRARK